MKRFKLASLCAALITLTALSSLAAGYSTLQGNYFTGGTNDVTLFGNARTNANQVLGAATNFFNLPGTTFVTNYFPPILIPDSLNNMPFDKVALQMQWKVGAAGSAGLIWKFAASTDQLHWYTNYWAITFNTNGVLATVNAIYNTNVNAFPFIALQQIENSGAVPVSNIWWNAAWKGGTGGL